MTSASLRHALAVIAYVLVALVLFVLLFVAWNYLALRILLIFGFLLFGTWSWRRGWQSMRVERKDRQRRWGIRRRVRTGHSEDAGRP